MEKQKRNRVPRGTVDAVGEIAFRLLADLQAPIVRRVLTEAGIPARLIGDGMLVGMERRFQTRLEELNNEEIQPEQGAIGSEVSQPGPENEDGKLVKSAKGRH